MAVMTLAKNMGVSAGYLGVGWDPNGHQGPIATAGFPVWFVETVGQYYKLPGGCNVKFGASRMFNLQMVPAPTRLLRPPAAPLARCATARSGATPSLASRVRSRAAQGPCTALLLRHHSCFPLPPPLTI